MQDATNRVGLEGQYKSQIPDPAFDTYQAVGDQAGVPLKDARKFVRGEIQTQKVVMDGQYVML